MTTLSGELQVAAMGRVGADALRAMCEAFRSFALQHPNRYLAMTRPAIDRSLMAAASIGADAAVRAALRAFELTEDEVFDAEVALYATAHGFVSLEVGGVFGGSVDATQADHLYAEAIERFVSGVERRSLDARA